MSRSAWPVDHKDPSHTPAQVPAPGTVPPDTRAPGRIARLGCLALGCLALAACSFGGAPPPSAQERADAATVAACRQRAEQVYEQQNRAAIYSPPPAINTPSSGAYAPGAAPQRGLADLYTRDQMVRDCIRNTGTQTERGRPPNPTNAP